MVGTSRSKSRLAAGAQSPPTLWTYLAPPDPFLSLGLNPEMEQEPLPLRGAWGLAVNSPSSSCSNTTPPRNQETFPDQGPLSKANTSRYLCDGVPVEMGDLIRQRTIYEPWYKTWKRPIDVTQRRYGGPWELWPAEWKLTK